MIQFNDLKDDYQPAPGVRRDGNALATAIGEFVPPHPVDWFRIFQDLTNAGLVPAEVARRLAIDSRNVYRWRNGKVKPNAEDALKIVAFHAWVMKPQ